jgi:DNA primase catalytic subunit
MVNKIRKLIRKKNRIHNKVKRLNKPVDWNKCRKIRNYDTSLVRKSRDAYQDKLVSRLSDDHPSTRTWWKICNHISGLKPSHYGIPALLKNNNLIFIDLDKANKFNNFFAM